MSDKQYKDPAWVRANQGIDAPLENKVKNEALKLASHGFRGQVLEQITDPSLVAVTEDSNNLMKHFGMYQQDNRDTRNERKRAGLDKEYSFMIRVKTVGGVASADQYLVSDAVCERYGNGTMRLTTRQTIQFHGVVKGNLQPMMTEMAKLDVVSYGACGDVVRNVCCNPIADISPDPIYSTAAELLQLGLTINQKYLPKSHAYYDIFITDPETNEKIGPKEDEEETTYGLTYMPRKFKIALTVPENNSVDVFTNDLGIVALRNPDGTLKGYNILVGGGMGSSHNNKETFPRAADMVAFVKPEDVLDAVDAVITIQRDYGNRTDRKRARLKYVLDELGPRWFHEEMERRAGKTFDDAQPIDNWGYDDHLGWHKQKDGKLYVGIFIENGRIADTPGKNLRTALRELIAKYRPQVRFTAQQNIVLSHIDPKDQPAIEAALKAAGISSGSDSLSNLRRHEIACVALPTCGLALAESERVLPTLIDKLEELGYGDEKVHIRMSGCPNACSRAPMSEIGLIGRAPGKYNLYLGGDYEGLRANILFKETVTFDQLPGEIGRLLGRWRAERTPGEAFGDYTLRVGFEALKS